MTLISANETICKISSDILDKSNPAFKYISGILGSIRSASTSPETMARLNIFDISQRMRSGLTALEELITSEKSAEEKLPEYKVNGKKLRLAAEEVNRYCLNSNNPPLSGPLDCEQLMQLALATQVTGAKLITQGMSQDLNLATHAKFIDNVFVNQPLLG